MGVVMLTDTPQNLTLCATTIRPRRRPIYRTVRGQRVVCGWAYTMACQHIVVQQEPGDTLTHTWTFPGVRPMVLWYWHAYQTGPHDASESYSPIFAGMCLLDTVWEEPWGATITSNHPWVNSPGIGNPPAHIDDGAAHVASLSGNTNFLDLDPIDMANLDTIDPWELYLNWRTRDAFVDPEGAGCYLRVVYRQVPTGTLTTRAVVTAAVKRDCSTQDPVRITAGRLGWHGGEAPRPLNLGWLLWTPSHDCGGVLPSGEWRLRALSVISVGRQAGGVPFFSEQRNNHIWLLRQPPGFLDFSRDWRYREIHRPEWAFNP